MSARQGNYPLEPDYWDVNQAATRLTAFACTVSARHLSHGMARMQFNREVAYFSKQVVDKVAMQQLSPEEGMKLLKGEQAELLVQAATLGQQTIGLLGGVSQMAAGAGACATGPLLCSFFGAPVFAHGANNVYENGSSIWNKQSNTTGPLRKAYQYAAKKLGFEEREGNMAYYTADIGLSGYNLFFRKILKPGAWRLFKYHDIDRAQAIRIMGHHTIFMEMVVSTVTLQQLIAEYFRK